jgi:hypothetical protein
MPLKSFWKDNIALHQALSQGLYFKRPETPLSIPRARAVQYMCLLISYPTRTYTCLRTYGYAIRNTHTSDRRAGPSLNSLVRTACVCVSGEGSAGVTHRAARAGPGVSSREKAARRYGARGRRAGQQAPLA